MRDRPPDNGMQRSADTLLVILPQRGCAPTDARRQAAGSGALPGGVIRVSCIVPPLL